MKKLFAAVVTLVTLLFAGISGEAQSKTGYIDVNELISIMPSAKRADSLLNDFRNALAQNYKDKEEELDAAIQKFYKDSGTMSSAVKEVKRKELQDKVQELSGSQTKLQEQLEKKNQELGEPVRKEALAAIQAVAKENGFTYVLVKEAVLVGPPGDDLLPLVKKKMGIK